MFKKIFSLILILSLTVTVFAGCGVTGTSGTTASGESADKLDVIVTIFPPYDFVRQIAGDKINLTQLLPLGAESHTYEPTTAQLLAIQKCDLFIYVGGEGDVWVDQILSALDTNGVKTMTLMECIDPLQEEHIEGMETEEEETQTTGTTESEEPEYDEHVWTSPKRVLEIVPKIAAALEELDSANASVYKQNAEAYIEKLTQLDKDYTETISAASGDTLVVADRFPFRYLTNDYGLKYYAAFPGCSSNTADPSAATVNFLINKVKTEKIPEVLYIELSDQKLANTVSEATGAKTAELCSCHNVTQEQFDAGTTYISLMTGNLAVLKTALNY